MLIADTRSLSLLLLCIILTSPDRDRSPPPNGVAFNRHHTARLSLPYLRIDPKHGDTRRREMKRLAYLSYDSVGMESGIGALEGPARLKMR
jgi:hypothetical protein